MTTKYPDDPDGNALAELEARGVNLSSQTFIEFAIDVPDENAALNIASVVRGGPYETEIYFDEGEPDYEKGVDDDEFGPSWTVYAKRSSVPTYDFLIKCQAELNELVNKLGGKVDGWGLRT